MSARCPSKGDLLVSTLIIDHQRAMPVNRLGINGSMGHPFNFGGQDPHVSTVLVVFSLRASLRDDTDSRKRAVFIVFLAKEISRAHWQRTANWKYLCTATERSSFARLCGSHSKRLIRDSSEEIFVGGENVNTDLRDE